MAKKLLLTALIMLMLGIPAVKAQKADKVYEAPKRAVSVQVPVNSKKLGIGARFSYDFTKILRFTVDADWYYASFGKGRMNTITRDLTKKGTTQWGRQFDLNANVNLVFGDGNFKFYLIAGFYGSLGHSKIDKFLHEMYTAITSDTGFDDNDDDDNSDPNIYHDEDGESYVFTDKISKFYTSGIGVNAGFGVEYQLSERNRIFIEQQASIGLMTVWMPKLGWTWCF